MARYTDSVCRLCRREGANLFLRTNFVQHTLYEVIRVRGFQIPERNTVIPCSFSWRAVFITCSSDSALHGPAIINGRVSLSNPQLEIADIEVLAGIAQKHRILLLADSTITPPNVFRAGDFGVNIEVVSTTKHRITSYNVCYTKLLRLTVLPLILLHDIMPKI